jgi:hypothetical protein
MLRSAAPLALALCAACTLERGFQTPATPQRPLFSRDTATTAEGAIELETGLALDPDDRFGTPSTLKYGLDARSELFLGFEPWLAVDRPGTDGRGFGDLVPGFRRRVQEQTDELPATAYLLAAKIPTADEDEGLGSGETDLFAAASADWDAQDFSATGFYRFGLLGEAGDGGVDLQHLFAAAGHRPLVEQLSGFGELALLWTPEQDDEQLVLTLGVAYAHLPGVVFDLGGAFGLSDDAPDAVLLLGATLDFGPQPWRIRP